MRRLFALLLPLLLLPCLASAQSYVINQNLTVVGAINTCTTNPSGGTDAYACALDNHITALAHKTCYAFVANLPNSGPASINYSGLGAKPIKKWAGGLSDLADNDIRSGMLVQTCYDQTNDVMQCQNCDGRLSSDTVVNVMDLGAKGDDTTDDTAAIQAALNLFGKTTTRTGRIYFPLGTYKITSTLTYEGSPSLGLHLEGDVGGTRSPSGSALSWRGAAGGTMMKTLGLNGGLFENLEFRGNSLAKYALHLDAVNTEVEGAAGSANNVLRRLSCIDVTGAESACFVFGHPGALTVQVDTVYMDTITMQGDWTTPGNSYYGIRTLQAGNVKDFYLTNFHMSGFRYGVYWSPASGSMAVRNGFMGGITLADFYSTGANLLIDTVEIEDTGARLLTGGTGTNPGVVTIQNVSWESYPPPDGYVIDYSGSLVLIGNRFHNWNNSTPPAVRSQGNVTMDVATTPTFITSINNWYEHATGYAPIIGAAPHQLLTDTGYYADLDVAVMSIGDTGGVYGTLTRLGNRVPPDTRRPPTRLFVNLGAPPNGSLVYCSDCLPVTPCVGSGTGALARRIAGAWECSAGTETVFNVKAYGATGDGTTNDTTAITNAYAAMPAAGGVLYFPPGRYIISQIVLNKANVTWRGAGREASVLQTNQTNAVFFPSGALTTNIAFEALGFDGGGIAQTLFSGDFSYDPGFLRFENCRFWRFTTSALIINSGYFSILNNLFEGSGATGSGGGGILLNYGPSHGRISGNKFRYVYEGVIGDADTTSASANERVIADVELSNNFFDLGFYTSVQRDFGPKGTVTYGASTLTDTGATFSGFSATDYVRVLKTAGTGTGTVLNTTVTDASATFQTWNVQQGEFIRLGGKFAIIQAVESQTILHVEEWLSETDRTVVTPPATGAYTVYNVYLGAYASNTTTQITVNYWHDLKGTAVTPASGTRYELLPGSRNYPFHCEYSCRNWKVIGNTFLRSYSDQISFFGTHSLISDNVVGWGQDMGITIAGKYNLVTNNRIERSGASGIGGLHISDSLIAHNSIIDSTWNTNTPNVNGGIYLWDANRVQISNNLIVNDAGIATGRYGIALSNPTDGIVLADNATRNHVTAGIRLDGPTIANTKLINHQSSGETLTSITSAVLTLAPGVTRTCMIVIGSDDAASSLSDTNFTNQRQRCQLDVPVTIQEIRIMADAGTPSVIAQKRAIGGTETALISGAGLATAASGGVACAKTTATTSYDGTTTCAATLQNNTGLTAGMTLGLTSGSASTAKRVSVAITFTQD